MTLVTKFMRASLKCEQSLRANFISDSEFRPAPKWNADPSQREKPVAAHHCTLLARVYDVLMTKSMRDVTLEKMATLLREST